MKIVHLNKEMVLENIERLIEIDRTIIDEEGTWTLDNFLMELNHKWDYCLVAFIGNQIVGFVICSAKAENLHIHRFAVLPEYQGREIGTSLIEHLFINCNEHNIKYVTVKSKKSNEKAQRFYERRSFKRIGTDGMNYVYMREMKWEKR
jgi:ribosomal protein S18 acetylase RimI-like enzyme